MILKGKRLGCLQIRRKSVPDVTLALSERLGGLGDAFFFFKQVTCTTQDEASFQVKWCPNRKTLQRFPAPAWFSALVVIEGSIDGTTVGGLKVSRTFSQPQSRMMLDSMESFFLGKDNPPLFSTLERVCGNIKHRSWPPSLASQKPLFLEEDVSSQFLSQWLPEICANQEGVCSSLLASAIGSETGA